MNFKKIIIACLSLTVYFSVYSQNSNVQSAANSLKFDEIADAKGYIDKAAENEQTSNNPKMWFYRGKVYQAISNHKDEKIRALDPDAAEKSVVSFLNCIKTDTKETYKDDVIDQIWISTIGVYNRAASYYNEGKLDKSIQLYNLIFEVMPHDKNKNLARNNITPEALYKNIYLTAYKAKDNKTAKIYLQKLIDAKYADPMIYIIMSRIYTEEKDTTKAMAVLAKGKEQFDTNVDITNEELNLYIAKGNADVLIDKFTKAIEADPEKDLYYFNRGTVYERKKDLGKAIEDYKKAISLNSDYFDAYYNLGILMFNQGAELINAANDTKSDAEFNKAKAKAMAKFKESLPYLEKASELQPKDKATLSALKQIYVRTGDNDKYKKVDEQLKSM